MTTGIPTYAYIVTSMLEISWSTIYIYICIYIWVFKHVRLPTNLLILLTRNGHAKTRLLLKLVMKMNIQELSQSSSLGKRVSYYSRRYIQLPKYNQYSITYKV